MLEKMNVRDEKNLQILKLLGYFKTLGFFEEHIPMLEQELSLSLPTRSEPLGAFSVYALRCKSGKASSRKCRF